MKRLTLHIVCQICMLCSCTAQVAPPPTQDKIWQNKNEVRQADSKEEKNVPSYRILSVEDTYTLRWTGKAFTGMHKNKVDTRLISSVIKGLDSKWMRHSLSIATKDVLILKDSVQKDAITIIAIKSAETRWNISTFDCKYFMIDECKAPLFAVPYFMNGSVYVICIVSPLHIMGDEICPVIDRKALYEDILKPLTNKPFF